MALTQIFKTDSKRILSDSFMVFMYIAPWATAVITKAGWVYLGMHYPDVSLDPVITTLAVALLTPLNMGIVLGFQLLEEKEQGVFRAIAVTPLNNDLYLLYRFAITAVVATVMTIFVHELLGLVDINLWYLVLIVVVAACQIPLQALTIAGFAKNTLEGFAVMKGTGFLLLVPLLVAHFFAGESLSWLAGIFPFFWLIRAYQFAVENQLTQFIICIGVGITYTMMICGLLMKYYRISALK
ncbi:hypothetical protein CS022_06635 [Veronia nyctiphanis]|uniref:ABC-2 type transporter domain-containing protein n=1 Tax=Veronia nyctiphanis TaxID=1278244 RepID=A0A4Q0YS04_9GAMM|nr:hypothetical protein [Veronia nyctiphanis]RXJ73952.1 hypothetical protein CS022_06635 [Veronia nyctiphanis]